MQAQVLRGPEVSGRPGNLGGDVCAYVLHRSVAAARPEGHAGEGLGAALPGVAAAVYTASHNEGRAE